jgi:hypothetical protein
MMNFCRWFLAELADPKIVLHDPFSNLLPEGTSEIRLIVRIAEAVKNVL